jgi:hypothetical protein
MIDGERNERSRLKKLNQKKGKIYNSELSWLCKRIYNQIGPLVYEYFKKFSHSLYYTVKFVDIFNHLVFIYLLA